MNALKNMKSIMNIFHASIHTPIHHKQGFTTTYITNQLHGEEPSWEAKGHSAGQEPHPHFTELGSSLPYSQEPITGSYPEPEEPSPHLLKL
jgi:hypothetical protein